MRNRFGGYAPGFLALCAMLSGGCGGGGGAAAPQFTADPTRGTVTVDLQFASAPAGRATVASKQKSGQEPRTRAGFAGNIPYGALSVRVNIVNPVTGAALAPERIVTAPATNSGLNPFVLIQFAALPVGPVRIDIAAFPKLDATGNALATGSVGGQIAAGQSITLAAPMTLTVTRVTVNPTQLTLIVLGTPAPIVAQALNASNQPLEFPLRYVSDDPDIADVSLSTQSPGQILVKAPKVIGQTQITVVEPNSGLSAIVQVRSDGT